MPLPRRFALLSSAALLIGTLAAASRPNASAARTPASTKSARIHAHFDSVLVELRTRDVSHLPGDRRARRAALVASLRTYDADGVFPNNYDFTQPTPYFVDRKTGTRCAVAHLLESTGRGDIVERVARTNNNVRVAELSADSAFTAWLDAQGLTLAEAARIQPTYAGGPDNGVPASELAAAGIALAVVGSAVATSLWNATGNADGHNNFGNVLGITSGVLTAVVGAAVAKDATHDRNQRRLGVATALAGGLSVALGLRGSARRSRAKAAGREGLRGQDDARGSREATFSPIIAVGRNPSAGMAMHLRF